MSQPGARADDEQLLRRMRELEARVARLEDRLETGALPRAEPPPHIAGPAGTAWAESVSAVPALGVSMVGLAGAYILRALTESHVVPQMPGVCAAAVYAALWLAFAARIPAARRVETVLYSLTSALVLGPLLWESTLRFHAITSWAAAAVLVVFTIFGLIISWRKKLIVGTIATVTGVLTAAALLTGSHDVVPFVCVLLAIAAAVEVSACLDHWLGARWLTAAAADLAVLLATYLATGSGGFPRRTFRSPRPAWSPYRWRCPAFICRAFWSARCFAALPSRFLRQASSRPHFLSRWAAVCGWEAIRGLARPWLPCAWDAARAATRRHSPLSSAISGFTPHLVLR